MAATALYFVAPGAVAPALVYVGVGAASAAVIVRAARRLRWPTAPAWTLLAAGIALFTLGDVIWYFFDLVRDIEVPAVSVADLSYLSGYPFLAAGVLLLVRIRTSGRHRDSVLDALMLALGASVLAWEWLIKGPLSDQTSPLSDRLVLAAYPVMDILILAAIARLVLTESRRLPAYWLLATGLLLMLASDVLYAWLVQRDLYPEWIDAGWLLSYVFLAAAVVHPSATRLGDAVAPATGRLNPLLAILLAGSLCAAPVALATRIDAVDDRVVLVGLFACLTAVVMLRIRGLVADKDRDLVSLAQAQDELSHLAMHDALTGLPNRVLFLDRLERALARRDADGRVAVLFVDLDRFKVLNDSAGHALGDEVLCSVAHRLKDAVRPEDTVSRLGGDEFTVLCEGVEGRRAAWAMAERLAAAVAAPIQTSRQSVEMTASIGIAVAEGPGAHDAAALLSHADAAMYRAKQCGRARCQMYEDGMQM
jgi:diguanylate cyclase (GGDEF)-like protein